ncbi:MAG: hypothetical protein IJX64_06345 [Clostridia bacterium]|nr:hypothetical protein [Clostridia bacterium]
MTKDTEDIARLERRLVKRYRRGQWLQKWMPKLLCLLVLALAFYLFYPITVPYEDLDLEVVEEDGVFYVYATWTVHGGTVYGVERANVGYVDYENKIDYTDYYLRLETSRWNLLLYPGREKIISPRFHADGREVGASGTHRHVDANGVAYSLTSRFGRVYYDDPSGTPVLLWECGDIPKDSKEAADG